MTRQHRSSAIEEKACSSGSTWIFRYRASIRGSRSRKAASRRKPFTAMLASVRRSQPSSLLLGQAPQRLPGPGRGLEGGLDQVVGQRLVAAGHHAGIPEQVPGMGPEAYIQLLGLVR